MKDQSHVSTCIAELIAYVGSLHIAHFLADTKTNEHKTLGDLYESMNDLTDEFSEVYMGAYGMVTFPDDAVISDVTDAPVGEGLELVSKLQTYFVPGTDDDLLNILADMASTLHKSAYLLKEKVEKESTEEEKKESTPKKWVIHQHTNIWKRYLRIRYRRSGVSLLKQSSFFSRTSISNSKSLLSVPDLTLSTVYSTINGKRQKKI